MDILVVILFLYCFYYSFSSTEKEPAAAERDVKTDKESAKPDDKDAKKQPEKDEKKEIIRSVWISGLSSVTRAVDLKTTFSKYGKVKLIKSFVNSIFHGILFPLVFLTLLRIEFNG